MGALWPKSGQLEFDNNGDPAEACKAYFYSGSTTTPYSVYQEAAESTAHAHPLVSDGNGRWPFVSIPFTESYSVKVVTAGGVQLYHYQGIPNADPIEASEDSVTASEVLRTGDVVWCPIDGTRDGSVRLNGRTVGSASSGATERANADTEALFLYLWNGLADGQAAVSTGRGASAAADFAANKTIALIDARGAGLYGLDTMGNSAASLLGSAPVVNGSTILAGSILGANTHTLTTAESAAHNHSFSATTGSSGNHSHTATTSTHSGHVHTGTTSAASATHTHDFITGGQSGSHTHQYDKASLTTATAVVSESAGTVTVIKAVGTSLNQTATTSGGTSNDHTHNGTTGNDSSTSHSHSFSTDSGGSHNHSLTTSTDGAHDHSVSGTSGSTGGGGAHNNLSRAILGTFFQKL